MFSLGRHYQIKRNLVHLLSFTFIHHKQVIQNHQIACYETVFYKNSFITCNVHYTLKEYLIMHNSKMNNYNITLVKLYKIKTRAGRNRVMLPE